jgi:hypothetical protein
LIAIDPLVGIPVWVFIWVFWLVEYLHLDVEGRFRFGEGFDLSWHDSRLLGFVIAILLFDLLNWGIVESAGLVSVQDIGLLDSENVDLLLQRFDDCV